jgi:hypothetical protein
MVGRRRREAATGDLAADLRRRDEPLGVVDESVDRDRAGVDRIVGALPAAMLEQRLAGLLAA